MDQRYSRTPIAIDVETGGINPDTDALLSIGAYCANGETFYAEIQPVPGLNIEESALKINGLNPDSLKTTGAEEGEVIRQLLTFIKQNGDATILGENPTFDAGFIRAACRRHNINCPLGYRAIDLHSVAASILAAGAGYPIAPSHHDPEYWSTDLNLDAILEWLGIPKREGLHNALDDARLTYQA
jgi:DNA polymerase III, epsilon subunit and related 3''-5'' exonucleases